MKKSKLALFQSMIALLLCASMLVGTTFAWFTESISSSNNLIATGNLDVELEYRDADGNWNPVTESTILFEQNALWEPGHTEVVYLRVSNRGSLALKYQLGVGVVAEVGSTNMEGNSFLLSDHIRFGVLPSSTEVTYATRDEARKLLTDPLLIKEGYTDAGELYPEGKGVREEYVTLVAYMPEDVGNAVNHKTGANSPSVNLGIALVASQQPFEEDSFGKDYDTEAEVPEFEFPIPELNESISVDATKDESGKTTGELNINGSQTSAKVPAGVQMTEEADKLTLDVKTMDSTGSNLTLDDDESLLSLDVHMDGVSAENKVPMTITLAGVAPKGLNSGNLKLYHVENGETKAMEQVTEFTAHNQFQYNPATGDIVLYMATFSEVALVADTVNAWNGKFDYTWYDATKKELNIVNADQLAGFGAIVGGMNSQTQDSFKDKKVTLIADINLGDKESENNEKLIFYPIGYYNSEGTYEKTGTAITSGLKTFEGIFDGAGHTISNFYQNTWEMKGDNEYYDATLQYYRDGMGLFGKVYGGTVKNLTVANFSSDGEYTTTGVIAAYADSSAEKSATFENIAIVECNPRVYNIGNGGIVGCGGWYSKDTTTSKPITFRNITVNKTNKISALWGSYDVACGGIMGQYYPNSGCGVTFENCNMAAQMDVYNDVCGNYQYYAYRYAGMMIGSIRSNLPADENGHVYPDMTGITAKNCTVNYGDWNDYYYCEFVKNGHPSYAGEGDYKFSRVPNSEIDATNGKENATCIGHNHTDVEDNQAVYLPFTQLFTGYGWGVTSKGLNDFDGIDIQIKEVEQNTSVEKFAAKFTGDFLYRVGNVNTVSVGSLFAAKDGTKINKSGVYVKIDKVYDESDVSCTFTANADDWTKSTLKFSGTGVVDISIQDYDYCTPTILHLEVVDATNATSAANATANNVVLLNDCNFSSLEVSGGYTLYGNGFTMTCGSDSAALDMGYSFVTLNNGTLDNVQIVCPNFDYAVLYKSNMTESGNRSETTDKTRYFNVKSGVMVSGNSQILNSRISGARAAVNVSGGNCVIDNSRIELGAVASILVGAANSLTLRDVTLVQKPTASTYDSSKSLMGFSVLMICNSEGDAAPVTLEGELVQNAWVDENDKQYVPSSGQSIISSVLTKTEYLHDIDGDGTNESLNLGFAYMPESSTAKVNTATITDNRTNKDAIPYDYVEVSIMNGKTYVYSYNNGSGTDDSFKEDESYSPDAYGDNIALSYSDTVEGLTAGKSYGTNGWVYELNVDLDKAIGYALDFSKLSMSANGEPVTEFKVDGNDRPTSPVPVTAGGTTYTITATVNSKEYTALFKVTGTETTKESPSLVASNYESALLVGEAGSTFSKDTWHGAAPVLNGIQIKYWSVAEKQYKTITLSDYTPTTAGKQNGTNSEWTYSPANGDFTLTIKNETAIHSNNGVYAMPVVFNSNLYFVASGSNGLVNYGNTRRTIKINYYFKDNNGGEELKFDHEWSIECANGNTAYDYSDFCNGTSKTFTIKDSNGEGCVTPDTLVTLSNGSQKRVDEVTYKDQLLGWNLYEGEYQSSPAAYIIYHGDADYRVIHLNFSDGTTLKIIGEHGLLDVTTGQYEFLDEMNVRSFIGHQFVKHDGNGHKYVTLESFEVKEEYTGAYSIASLTCNNAITDSMVSLTPVNGFADSERFFNFLEMGEGMKYDTAKMQKDIETYGLFEYKDLAAYLTEEEFEFVKSMYGHYCKIAIGKGYYTLEEFLGTLSHEDVVF